jgi:hypothetical protein
MRSHRLPEVPSAGGRPDGVVVEARGVAVLWARIQIASKAKHVPRGAPCAGAELQPQTTERRGLHGAHTMAPRLQE